ncbi:MAG: extradiol dioxygenase [Gemmatimonadota bacterium]
MIIGAHLILYSMDAEADRAFLRDVLEFPHVDAGHDWLIFALPPTEVAVHPGDDNGQRELYLLCDDLAPTLARLDAHRIGYEPVVEARWGIVTHLTLPGGGRLGLYTPRHPLAIRPLHHG